MPACSLAASLPPDALFPDTDWRIGGTSFGGHRYSGASNPKVKRMRRVLTILMICAFSAGALAGPSLEEDAKAFLARLAALGDAYDPALADLYADDAANRTGSGSLLGQARHIWSIRRQYSLARWMKDQTPVLFAHRSPSD